MIAIEDHVHSLEHEALGIVLEDEDALAAQDAGPLLLHQVLHPGKELVGIERFVASKRQRMHLFVVIVLEAAAMMVMVMIVIMLMRVVMVMSIVMMTVIPQKLRLDLQDAVEIEGVAPEHLRQRNPAALGLVQPGVRIDAADAGLDFSELVRLPPGRSC